MGLENRVGESTSSRAAIGKNGAKVLAEGRIGKLSPGKGFPILDPGPNAVCKVRVSKVRGPRAPTAGGVVPNSRARDEGCRIGGAILGERSPDFRNREDMNGPVRGGETEGSAALACLWGRDA